MKCNGIFNYLTNQTKGNIVENGTIKISSDKEDGITLGTVRLDDVTSPIEKFESFIMVSDLR